MTSRVQVFALMGALGMALCSPAAWAQGTFSLKLLTPETALAAAQAALKRCRDQGYQVAVAVVDRFGVPQILLRDRFAGPHTVDAATGKAWTAVSFRTPTVDLVGQTQPGGTSNGIRNLPRVVILGGGVLLEGGGSILGGIGVSGAPGGEADDGCAKAGVAAVRDALEF